MTMEGKTRILVVEDEEAQRWALRQYLSREGYQVIEAPDGETGLRLAREGQADLAVVDVMLPGLDGFELVKQLRRDSAMPVLFLTARGEEWNRVAGLEIGADDYVVKPFSVPEVVARVRAHLRRAREPGSQSATPGQVTTAGELRVGGVSLYLDSRRCTLDGRPVELTRREFDLLATLVRRRGQALSRRQLLEEAWGTVHLSEKTVDVHLTRLRRKLGQALRITPLRGVGYRLEAG
jgi:DNA-binding response OmpR family regulator